MNQKSEVLKGEPEQVKKRVLGLDERDYGELLQAEKESQNRDEIIGWLKKRKNQSTEDQIKGKGGKVKSKMKDLITDVKNDDEVTIDLGEHEGKLQDINQGVEDNVQGKGRTTQPKQLDSGGRAEEVNEENSDEGNSMPGPKELHPDKTAPTEEMAKKNHNLDSEGYDEFESRIQRHGENFQKIRDMLQRVIVGQEEPVEKVLIALMCDGNILLEGVPGLGKSLLVETLSRTVSNTEMNRIQFVPDMLPSDILGQRVYNQDKGEFYINKGPVFANFLLADEINRAPPKTQAAMMEVMQEKKVSIEKEEFQLEPPYLVLATQNPLEQKGTYPLPEAVIDRFFMKLVLDYPEPEEEVEILQRNSIKDTDPFSDVEEVVDKEDILRVQEDVRDIYISPVVQKYIVDIITTARGDNENGVSSMEYVDFGPSPRASIWLSLGASAYAILDGRTYVIPDDVKKIAKPILRHRILLNYEGKISSYSTDDVIDEILENVDTV